MGTSVFVAACRIFSCSVWTLSSGMWYLVPWPGIEPRPHTSTLEVWSLSHWTKRDALPTVLLTSALLTHFRLCLCPLFPVSGSRGLIRPRFDSLAQMRGAVGFFHWKAHNIWFSTLFLPLEAVDPWSWPINSLEIAKWWYSHSTIFLYFISWNNFIKIDIPSICYLITQRAAYIGEKTG